MLVLVEAASKIDDTSVLYHDIEGGYLDIVKYLVKNGAIIQDDCITNVDNEINRFLYINCKPNQESLFNQNIVDSLNHIKKIIS